MATKVLENWIDIEDKFRDSLYELSQKWLTEVVELLVIKPTTSAEGWVNISKAKTLLQCHDELMARLGQSLTEKEQAIKEHKI